MLDRGLLTLPAYALVAPAATAPALRTFWVDPDLQGTHTENGRLANMLCAARAEEAAR